MTELQISPQEGLIDERLRIRVTGCQPGSEVKIKARISTLKMASEAIFQADDSGSVDLSQIAPLSGSYDWVDPMGLILTMKPELEDKVPGIPKFGLDPFNIEYEVLVDNEPVIKKSIERHWLAEGTRRVELREDELRGVCFYPPGDGPFPAIITVSGSGGGVQENKAVLFANHGYVTLTLGYFAYEDRPKGILNIPLEYFEKAADWLIGQEVVDPNKLVITGGSRGGELSLLSGSMFPVFKMVVAYVPSSVVWGGISAEREPGIPAWTYRGVPVLFYSQSEEEKSESDSESVVKEPIPLTPIFLKGMKNPDLVRTSTIPVEKIKAPILLISGEDDQMWPSSMFSERVVDRLAKYQFSYPYKHLSYSGAGHLITSPYMPLAPDHGIHPVDGKDYAFGGNPKDQAFANEDSWFQVLNFLKEHLH
ncbi:MAG: acyl-CoA thioesterase/BAAT N-terminal domain-containing protein [Anaerolineaceae bacterium]|nr:acyl-CoA thioesterase/BAAT N-terminal domain-containing protein [Anaerolineaceae bacterium]